jgi:4-diphosphocytidyl-2-C-methyl-D-erythritol kinase
MKLAATITTGCKINLFLKVGQRLPNGYHAIDTFFLPLPEPHDTLDITEATANGLTVECSASGIVPTNNTLTKAYSLYAEATRFAPPLRLRLNKGVPQGAGLGGGSANAAGLLAYLEKCRIRAGGAALPPGRLNSIAATVGADAPFFLLNVPARAQGIGEHLAPAPNPVAGRHLALLCPDIRISTAWAFAELDALRRLRGASDKVDDGLAEKRINDLTTGAPQATTSFSHEMRTGNDFEEVVFSVFPALRRLCNALREMGASVAHVSGTGSSVFGLFAHADDAWAAVQSLATADSVRIKTYVHAL